MRLIDADALSEKLCETTIFIKDGEVFQRMINDAPTVSAEAVPRSEQYKKGFEDAKRAFLIEYARESENMRKRNAQLEVMLNAQNAILAEAGQGFRGGKIPPKEMLDGTVLIPQHQWLDMERELAELKEKSESAEAKPTVIRSRTLLPTKDFEEWAKRVREGNPNVIVIPCDAEVVSEPKTGWIPVSERLLEYTVDMWDEGVIATVEGQEGNIIYKHGIVSNAWFEEGEWYINDVKLEHARVTAWMPLPEPYREEDEE